MCNCVGVVGVEPSAHLLLDNADEITTKENPPSIIPVRCFGDVFPLATENSPNRVIWQKADFLTCIFCCTEQVVISF